MSPATPLALITGGCGGIGTAVAAALARDGYRVLTADTAGNPDLHLDVTSPEEVTAVVERVERSHGPIEALVSAAGILHTGPALDTPPTEWERMFRVNTAGVFLVTTAVARRMVPRGRGSLVVVSSNAGRVPRHGMAGYGASKAAATLFTQSLGLELAGHGIRCNVVSPGSTRTPLLDGVLAVPGGEAALIAGDPRIFKAGIPLGRLADPAHIAEAVAFLVSNRAAHLTMQELVVDGGATLSR
ncbi:2,3-dihydro-2,3-dihydroxybenzoate dehydrogenase [Klugiella xanthotipulae]|uniref:2,3-dihydro-2,3-dihydroxybenzoate dehydrogenase n=1 Tax=Klugiella xanthotipulae TaxID=244735 RepID=A0A543HHA3_9MICO|nr:SDR family oxidoreductase [Klugiella xanthotipulae]TQM57711.1 2,3-dihydro-2,3-dihydroxybenzoate dehydrogenase [Klugiella xanthotipulae]